MEVKVGDTLMHFMTNNKYSVVYIDAVTDTICINSLDTLAGTKIITRSELVSEYTKTLSPGAHYKSSSPRISWDYHQDTLFGKKPTQIDSKDPFHSKKCECGSTKVYGQNCPADHHSDFCPLYEGRK